MFQPNIPYDFYSPSNNRFDLIDELPTIIHEEYHSLNMLMNLTSDSSNVFRRYFFKGETYKIRKTPIFESSEISQIIPPKIQDSIFRYKTYIVGNDKAAPNPDSKINGIYGIFEEFAAYCTGFGVYVRSYSYLRSNYPFDSTNIWIRYLTGAASSDIYSYYEFKLFIFWYMEWAKIKYPKLYAEINLNVSLKAFNRIIDEEFVELISEYWTNRKEIEKNINPRIMIRGNSIYKKGDLSIGFGLPDDQLMYTKKVFEDNKDALLGCLK